MNMQCTSKKQYIIYKVNTSLLNRVSLRNSLKPVLRNWILLETLKTGLANLDSFPRFLLYSDFFLSGLSPIARQRESMGKGNMMVELCSVAIALSV